MSLEEKIKKCRDQCAKAASRSLAGQARAHHLFLFYFFFFICSFVCVFIYLFKILFLHCNSLDIKPDVLNTLITTYLLCIGDHPEKSAGSWAAWSEEVLVRWEGNYKTRD